LKTEERKTKHKQKPAKKRRVRVFPIILLLIVVATAIILIDSNTRIETAEYELFYPNLPAPFDGFRIVVLSDIHAAEFGENNERLISRIIAAQPDMVAITGDLIDGYKRPTTERQLEIAETLVTALAPIAPIYYVTGNHDWDSGALRQLITMLEEHGVYVLRNRHLPVRIGGGTIIIAGTDDPNGPADMIKPREFVERVFASESAGTGTGAGASGVFTVMLEHRNHNLALYSELGVDLVLCGHAHGGIIRLPFTDGLFGPRREWFPSYTNGVYTMGGTNMVVSRGIGNHTGFPRFLNNPHIVVAILRTE
jgi:hypothetical protein